MSDHIFTLQTLINEYTCKQGTKTNQYLYVCFIDLCKAFDTIWPGSLFHKLLENGVRGKLFDVIRNMYSKSKTSIKLSSGLNKFFETNIGMKQGCVISPTLFNIFLNHIPDIFDINTSDPVTLYKTILNCLVYADDISIMSTSTQGLQHCLNKLSDYCKK